MKKKNLKGLRLKREKVSKFTQTSIIGGLSGQDCGFSDDICFKSGDIECDWSLGQEDWDNHPTLGLCPKK